MNTTLHIMNRGSGISHANLAYYTWALMTPWGVSIYK
ncbi:hypothetical protein M2133_000253 [Parabacteroides sp. PF5-6]|nr:hypothetical protein [Parabacteroides sp. PF5-6]